MSAYRLATEYYARLALLKPQEAIERPYSCAEYLMDTHGLSKLVAETVATDALLVWAKNNSTDNKESKQDVRRS